MKKILLTGGSGFIGKNIQESFLNDKHQLFAPTRSELDCADDDNVANFFLCNSFDVVIHSATKPGHRNAANTDNLLYTNSRMTFNILKHKDSWGKLINLGSGAIYDMLHYKPKMKENYFGTFIPKDEHGYNKYILGNIFSLYKNVVDLRIFGIYGKYEDYAIRFISNVICKVLFDLPITIKQNRKFDYIYIDDLMPVLDYFIMNDSKHNSYNVTPDESVELLFIAKLILEISKKKLDIQVLYEGMGLEYSGDNSLLKNELTNFNFTSLYRGVESLFNWYKENNNLIDRSKLLMDK